ncbi:MAG TPA: hypothetical protein VJX67_05510 [Blastocatellia bacterium]|nr:hypothetical protein [Blastocatellia bacterium]
MEITVGIAGVYARVGSERSIEEAGRKLIALCRRSWLSHRIDAVERATGAMLGLPLRPEIRNVARCYQAYCLAQKGETARAAEILDGVLYRVDPEFRPRATLALARVHFDTGRLISSAPIYLEAARAAEKSDPLTRVQALRMLAIIRSIDGDHSGALADLERLLAPMRRLALHYPSEYYHYLNSLAIELGEVGRIEEANRAIGIVLGSRLASQFPQWLDTKEELATKPRRAFPPFKMALGSPEIAPLSDKTQDVLPAIDVAVAEGPRAAVTAKLSHATQPKFGPRRFSIPFRDAQQTRATGNNACLVRNERLLATGRGRPRSLSGYAISPPSRAPPVL